MENRCCCGCHQTLLHLKDYRMVWTSVLPEWMDGSIYSDADVPDKQDNQTRLVMFVKDHNIFGFWLLKKNTS